MQQKTNTLAIILSAIALFSAFYLAKMVLDSIVLQDTVARQRLKISTLQQDRQQMMTALDNAIKKKDEMSRKNILLKEYLRQSNFKVRKLDSEFKKVMLRVDGLNSQIGILQSENIALRSSNEGLKEQVAKLSEENEQLRTRFSSLAELKKAIRNLRRQGRDILEKLKRKPQPNIGNNRGYIIKDGVPTYPQRVKIEVIPVSE